MSVDSLQIHRDNLAELLTIDEAAKRIRMSSGWIRSAVRAGELRIVRFGKVRGVRIRPEDLEAFVRNKIVGIARSHEQGMAALAKIEKSLNQWVTPHDR